MSAKRLKPKQPAAKPIDAPPALAAAENHRSEDKHYFIAGAVLAFLISFIFYIRTMAVSASFWDSGEFIATAHSLAIPHSPGTPLYVLMSRVFTLLPLPLSVAQKVNLLSALCGALGVLFIYLISLRLLDFFSKKSAASRSMPVKVMGGLTGALFIAFSSTYWTNAVEAEVYSMSCFLMGAITWLGLKWADNPKGPKATAIIYLLFYLLAMSVGFHLGTILAFSGIFLFVWLNKEKPFSNFEFLIASLVIAVFVADATLYRNGRATLIMLAVLVGLVVWLYHTRSPFAAICSALFVLGLSVHLYLLIRSSQNPAIDMGDPETWRSLYAVLRREQYPAINPLARKASIIFQLQHFNNYYQSQFEMFSLYLGKLNLGSLLPLAVGIWGMVEHYTRNKRTFILLFSTFLVTSLGLILFLNFSAGEVRERDYFYSPAFYYFSIFIGIGAASILGEIKSLLDNRVKAGAPAMYFFGAIIVALPFFTAKHHFFSHDRSKNYTCRDYSMNVLKPLKKDAIIFTHGDNDSYPLWYIQQVENYRKDVRVVIMPLLNTPWYIKQLRNNAPQLPIRWTDEQVDSLQPVPVQGGWLSVRDIAMRHIIRENNWKRPVYFAVTIAPEALEPYRDYLEMQGLVYELVPKKGTNMINTAVLEDSIFNKYSYRSILTDDWKRDTSVYLPKHTRSLIQNYALAFVQLGHLQKDDPEKAVRAMRIAHEIAPHFEPAIELLGRYYFMAGDTQKAFEHYEEMIRKYPGNLTLLLFLAELQEKVGDANEAIRTLEEIIERNPNERQAVLSLYGVSVRANLLQRARRYLVWWLNGHPDDEEVREILKRFDDAVEVVPRTGDS